MSMPLSPSQIQQLTALVSSALGPPSVGEGFANPVASIFQAGNTTLITAGGLFIYDGSPAEGNLILSMSPDGGTDAWGNAFPQGLGLDQAGGNFVLNSSGLFFYGS